MCVNADTHHLLVFGMNMGIQRAYMNVHMDKVLLGLGPEKGFIKTTYQEERSPVLQKPVQ